MKRLITLPLLVLYLCVNIGFYINAHYCGGELAHLALSTSQNNAFSCDDEADMEDDCCKNTHQSIKIKELHQKTSNSYTFQSVIVDNDDISIFSFLPYVNTTFDWTHKLVLTLNTANAPPPLSERCIAKNSLQSLLCVYRI